MGFLSQSAAELVAQKAARSARLPSLCGEHPKLFPVFRGSVAHPFVPHAHLRSTGIMETIELYCTYLFDFLNSLFYIGM